MKISARQRSHIVKAVAFVLIFIVLLVCVSRVMTVNAWEMEYQLMTGIYTEEENSLDAVYLGSSNCYAYWNPVVAWEEHGISVYKYNCSYQPLLVAEYLIKEARKTQPDAVYIINVNTLGNGGMSDATMHRLLDYMPLSAEKLEFTNWMVKSAGLSFSESLEYYFPLVRYHSRWNELSAGHFSQWDNTIKNSATYSAYLRGITDITAEYKTSVKQVEISALLQERLNSLLDYLDENAVKAVFVTVPRAEYYYRSVRRINTVNEIVASRGYPVVDLMNKTAELGIDMTTDFYNNTHTNIHGSIKFTNYLSEYLIENYGFADKRGDADYVSWQEATVNYHEIIDDYILDFETHSDSRDYSLPAAANIALEKQESGHQITWDASAGADGYIVYRKGEQAWTRLGKTTSCRYTAGDINEDEEYTYTVVPYTESDGEMRYGNFSYTGVSADS